MILEADICEGCGQLVTSTLEGLCSSCRRAQYGGDERHEAARLFAPAPAQLAGQESLGLE